MFRDCYNRSFRLLVNSIRMQAVENTVNAGVPTYDWLESLNYETWLSFVRIVQELKEEAMRALTTARDLEKIAPKSDYTASISFEEIQHYYRKYDEYAKLYLKACEEANTYRIENYVRDSEYLIGFDVYCTIV